MTTKQQWGQIAGLLWGLLIVEVLGVTWYWAIENVSTKAGAAWGVTTGVTFVAAIVASFKSEE